ncbi:glycosyltransferase involved in cell wall biosynthesis [Clostridium punense]|uniref:Glycosyltransferase involved in cell wall biosynthesis n=1 Tax=Clostridium punense TaxID=1054297 RepID=A0ABS4K043_9CLOT|nr:MULTISPECIES: glycosyltransferase family 4 protein [Clostridium]EQB88400.1 hypothetical protein M918_04460 [Clostridium sp. BL8]MBP2021157.1 glycosyltransferase involved in cell wall biosynthesis [Clostridium punense]
MKKILYVTNTSRSVNTFFIPHMNALVDHGYKVDCACKIGHAIYKERVRDDIEFFDVPFSRNPLSTDNVKAFKQLCELQRNNQYDVIHAHTPIVAAYVRLMKLKFPNLKIMYTAHGYHFYEGASKVNWAIYYPIEKILAKYTDLLININDEDYNASKKFSCKKLAKINGVGIDLDKFKVLEEHEVLHVRASLGLSKEDFVVVMIAEHNKNKNQIQLLNAMEILKSKHENIKAVCIGDGELLEEIKGEVEKRALSNVKILGFRKDVNEIINASDVAILLSHREGLPKNLMEVMACKKPLIGTNVRGIRDLIEDGVNGKIVPLGDPVKTAEAIEYLYNNKQMLKAMGEESYNKIQKFTMDEILEEILRLHNQVLNQ